MTDMQQLLDMASIRMSAYSGYRCAFASGSLVEGYGNPTSDLDVFVVWPDAGSSAAAPRTTVVDGIGIELNFDQALKMDIEHWSADDVKALAAQISDTPPLDFERVEMIADLGIQFAHRLRVGAYVAGPTPIGDYQHLFDWRRVAHLNAARFLTEWNDVYEDASGAVVNGDHGPALLSSRAALGAAMDAYLGSLGSTNNKAKWRFPKMKDYCSAALVDEYVQAEMEPSPEPHDILKTARKRLRLSRRLSESAQAILEGG